jgi:DNA repair protein RadA/Sms
MSVIYVCPACGQHSLLSGLCAPCMRGHKYVTKIARIMGPVQSLAEVSVQDMPRYPVIGFTGIENALAGGFVKGSVLLLHGGPGVGKSTLGLQLCEAMGRYQSGGGLYVSAEQMLAHVKMMAMRVQVDSHYVRVVETKLLEEVIYAVESTRPVFVVVDSLQEIHLTYSYEGREIVVVCEQLVRLARETNCAILLLCHETKDDTVAGPRILEHLVDGMVSMESSNATDVIVGVQWRLHTKYRFGPVPKDVFLLRTEMGRLYERGSATSRNSCHPDSR